ncbi:hypothetical protein GCM10009706_18440 [Curtobacterium citreum]|uniref:hypothetical protein n=1 Tax=Curtobacterium TaxID=2034 RepID=UPI00159A5252|nr:MULTISPECIES: hypothetical protein [Curtobacterium]QKS13095.1 hypothetical protein HUN60_08050 [Curtobacterium sp. csp3]GGL80223.1 hypothetical protein GCM10009706_18440 [Curtobacterium citreum]
MLRKNHVIATTAVTVGLLCAAAAPASAATNAFGTAATASASARASSTIPGSSTELRYFGGVPVLDLGDSRLALASSRSVVVSGVASAAGTFHLSDGDRELCSVATQGLAFVCEIPDLAPGERELHAFVTTPDGSRTAEDVVLLRARVEKPNVTSATRHGDVAVIEGTATPGAHITVATPSDDATVAEADANDGTFRVEAPVRPGNADEDDAFRVRATVDLPADQQGDPEDSLGTSAWTQVDVDDQGGTPDPGTGGPSDVVTPPTDVDPGFTPQPGDGGETPDPGDGGEGETPAPVDPIQWIIPTDDGAGYTSLQVRGEPGTSVTATTPTGDTVRGRLDGSGSARLQLHLPSQFRWSVQVTAEHDGATAERTVEVGTGPRADQGTLVATAVSKGYESQIWFAGATGSVTISYDGQTTTASGNESGWGRYVYGPKAGTVVTVTDASGASTTITV